jgi:uncharacterized PurR-regulated membrane protein YhhQ (DUF165 family)
MLRSIVRRFKMLIVWGRRFLWKVSSYDFRIVDDLEKDWQYRFTWLGLLVLSIGVLCFLSTAFAFQELLASGVQAIALGVFTGLLLTNMYFFTLYTLHPNTLPSITNKFGKRVSVSIRLVSILFIATLIGQLVSVWCWQDQMSGIVSEEKVKQKQLFRESLAEDERYLNEQIADFVGSDNGVTDETRAIFTEMIETGKAEREQALLAADQLISNNKMLLYQIEQLHSRFPFSWSITMLVILIFMLPAYLILSMKREHPYYQAISQTHSYMIDQAYTQFTKSYPDLIKLKTDKYYSFEEHYQDPPYNLISKPKFTIDEFLSKDDIIESLYGDQEQDDPA